MKLTIRSSYKDREKAEQELAISVKKAVNPDETAPKQKHVRVCYLFTHDFRTSQSFFHALKSQPILSDDVQCFKSLIVIHKVTREGHACVLQDLMREVPFLDVMGQHSGGRGYGALISAYVRFLKHKLEFHTMHPEFTADLDYEEYRALRKVDDPNEGYGAIIDLMNLLEKLDQLQKTIFSSFRPSSNNECRISALVPLVEESYGIYKFNSSMLTAMHQTVASHDALAPLRERFKQQYGLLQKFYFECSNLRYLTSLITVPRLPNPCPDFTDVASKREEPEPPKEIPEEDLWGSVSNITPEPFNQQQPMMLQDQQFLMQQQQMTVYNNQLIDQYQQKIFELETRLREYESRLNEAASLEHQTYSYQSQIQQLQQEVLSWKTKYENMAKMYAQLRKEHLDLLQKYKNDVQMKAGSQEQLQKQVELKQGELQEAMLMSNRVQSDLEVQKEQFSNEVSKLRRELGEQKAIHESVIKSSETELNQLRAELQAKTQEVLMLQQGMSSSLDAMEMLKKKGTDQEQQLVGRMDQLNLEHRNQMDRIMDSVLEDCKNKVSDALLELDSENPIHQVTPELILSLVEKLISNSNEFSNSFTKHLTSGDKSGVDQAEAITKANNISQSVFSVLSNGRGLDDQLIQLLQSIGAQARVYLSKLQSKELSQVPFDQRPETVKQNNIAFLRTLEPFIAQAEQLMPKTNVKIETIDDEMVSATKAIEEASQVLTLLLTVDQSAFNKSVLNATKLITDAICRLIICATHAQQEIVANGKESKGNFYKKNSRWIEGLISSAKAVAGATRLLVEKADGFVNNKNEIEVLLVASNEVAASTVQLVAASRVKAVRGSKTQAKLEEAAKAVSDATKALVKEASEKRKLDQQQQARSFTQMTANEFKKKQMEMQVRIMTLEKSLTDAREDLAAMRRFGYHQEADYTPE